MKPMKNGTVKKTGGPLRQLERSEQELQRRIFHLKTLFDLSHEIGFLNQPIEIIKNLLMMIIGTFGASSGFILLADTGRGKVEAFTQRSMPKNSIDRFSQLVESGYFKALNKIAGVQILNEGDTVQEKERQEILDILCSYDIKIWIPFDISKHLSGGIGLGGKLSGESYTTDDQELLSTMAKQGVVAIENSMLVEQMKKDESVRANLARYLSPQIVEQVMQKNMQVNLGGNKKVVTVLFSDIRSFTRISETLPPDQLTRLLNEYFTEMAKIIFGNQGSLDKYIGDAIVAVFGSLIPLNNHSRTAAQAAVQMMKSLSIANQRWTAQYGFPIHIGIGINTGEVFLGNIGSPERMEFTVIGDTVNIASRLSGAARPGQILITKETLAHLGSDIPHQALSPIEVKGKKGKLEIFEVVYS
jgi:class 3 adenylate cyclase